MGDEYAPARRGGLVGVWLYAYALEVTSSRRLEQRVREDLAFRYLAGGATPDFWMLNRFRRQHGRALNDLFTKVSEAKSTRSGAPSETPFGSKYKDEKRQEIDRKGGNLGDHRGAIELKEHIRQE